MNRRDFLRSSGGLLGISQLCCDKLDEKNMLGSKLIRDSLESYRKEKPLNFEKRFVDEDVEIFSAILRGDTKLLYTLSSDKSYPDNKKRRLHLSCKREHKYSTLDNPVILSQSLEIYTNGKRGLEVFEIFDGDVLSTSLFVEENNFLCMYFGGMFKKEGIILSSNPKEFFKPYKEFYDLVSKDVNKIRD